MNNFKSAQVLPFIYVVQATLGNTVGATATVNLTTDSASYFELHQIGGSSSLDTDTDFMPNNFTLKVSEQSTGRDLTGGQIPQRIISGPANQGVQLRRLVSFPPNTTFQFTIVNTVASANVVDIALCGFKLYQLT